MENKHRRIFEEITKTYAREFSNGSMIPVSCVDKASDVKLLHIARKTHVRKYIFRQKTRYSPEKIPLEKVLVSGEIIELEQTSQTFGPYSLECNHSMNASLNIKNPKLFGANASASEMRALKVNLETKKEEIDRLRLKDVLENRQFDLNHQAVCEIRKDTKASLCVITTVYSLVSEAQIEKKHERNSQAGVNAEVDGVVNIGVSGGVKSDKQKVLDLKIGTNLAYKVSELKIDTTSGRIKVALLEDEKGGFLTTTDDPNAEEMLIYDQNRLQMVKKLMMPILNCSDECKNNLQNLVYDLRREPSDVMMMIELLDDDESETKEFIPIQKCTWSSLLKVIKTQNKDGLYELSPLRTPLAYILESLSELTEMQFECIKSLDKETGTDLLKLCKNLINKGPMVELNKDKSPILHCSFTRQLAEDMGIKFTAGEMLAKLKDHDIPSPLFEYVFWILYAFYES